MDGWWGEIFPVGWSYDVLLISQQSESFVSFCQDSGFQPVVHKAAGVL